MLVSRHDRPDGSFVLPVCRCPATVADSLERLTSYLAADRESWELIVVDDGSDDGTAEVVADWQGTHPGRPLRLIRLSRNRGKGVAVRTGLAAARGTLALFTDADLPYGLEAVQQIVARLRAGAAAAIACRVLPESRYQMSPAFFSYLYTRHLMGRSFNLLCRTLVLPGVLDTQAGLKGLDLPFVRPLLSRMVLDGFSFDVELLRAIRDAGGAIEEVPVVFRYDSEPSTVRFIADSLRMARDLARIRWRSLRGTWRRASSPRVETVADDFGLSADVNDGIRELLEQGAVTGTSILAGAESSSEAIAWAASHPQFDYGAHLSLTEGRPVLDPARVPSLVGPDGRFVPLGRFFRRWLAGRIRIDEVRAEWSAQIDRLREAGVPLRRLDSHQHVHLLAPLFRGVACPLARTHGLRVRTMSGVGRPRLVPPDLRGVILRAMSWWSRRAGPAGVALSAGTGTTLLGCPELREVRRLVARAPDPETVELVVHPGRPSSRQRTGSRWDAARGREFFLLLEPELRALLQTIGAGYEAEPLGGSPEAPARRVVAGSVP